MNEEHKKALIAIMRESPGLSQKELLVRLAGRLREVGIRAAPEDMRAGIKTISRQQALDHGIQVPLPVIIEPAKLNGWVRFKSWIARVWRAILSY